MSLIAKISMPGHTAWKGKRKEKQKRRQQRGCISSAKLFSGAQHTSFSNKKRIGQVAGEKPDPGQGRTSGEIRWNLSPEGEQLPAPRKHPRRSCTLFLTGTQRAHDLRPCNACNWTSLRLYKVRSQGPGIISSQMGPNLATIGQKRAYPLGIGKGIDG